MPAERESEKTSRRLPLSAPPGRGWPRERKNGGKFWLASDLSAQSPCFAVAIDASAASLPALSLLAVSPSCFKSIAASLTSSLCVSPSRRRHEKRKESAASEEETEEGFRNGIEKKNQDLDPPPFFLMDFDGAAQRLRREQRAAAQRAREKAERERAEATRAAVVRERAEEEKRQRRLAQLQREEEARLAEEAALEASKGVSWSSGERSPLAASAIDPARSAAARGIRRGARDKAMMPRGAGASLVAQNSRVNGAPAFELVAVGPAVVPGEGDEVSNRAPRRTHVGVLDYGCEDGRVALPPAVAARLWPWAQGLVSARAAAAAAADDVDDDDEMNDEQASTTTSVTALPLALAGTGVPPGARVIATYRALPKGTFARLQPLEAGFQQAAGEDVKEILEAALAAYCCLTEGDTLDVEVASVRFTLRVQALLPAEAVSLAETDLEVEVEPSEETAQRLAVEEREREAARRRAREAAARLLESKKAQEEAAESAARALEAERAARDARRRELAESLPPEPDARAGSSGSSNLLVVAVVAFRLRTPDGRSASRRFDAASTPVSILFDWADSLEGGGAGAARGGYDLVVAGSGGKVLEPPSESENGASPTAATATTAKTTLAEAGFDRGGFALLVRPRAAAVS